MDEKSKIHIENSSMNYLFLFFLNLFLKLSMQFVPRFVQLLNFRKRYTVYVDFPDKGVTCRIS